MGKCILDVWEGRIPTCMAGYLVCDEEKCPNFIQEVKMKLNGEEIKNNKTCMVCGEKIEKWQTVCEMCKMDCYQ